MFRVGGVCTAIARLARHLLSGPPVPDERRGTQSNGSRQDGSGGFAPSQPTANLGSDRHVGAMRIVQFGDHGIGDGVRAAVHAAVGPVLVSRRLLCHVARRVHPAIAQQFPAAIVPAVRLAYGTRGAGEPDSCRPEHHGADPCAITGLFRLSRRDLASRSSRDVRGWTIGAAACARSLLATAAAGSGRHVRNTDAAVEYHRRPPRRTPEAPSAAVASEQETISALTSFSGRRRGRGRRRPCPRACGPRRLRCAPPRRTSCGWGGRRRRPR